VIKPNVIEIENGKLLLTNISEVITTCNTFTQRHDGCKFCVLEIPCYCAVLADSFAVSPRIVDCQNETKITVYQGLNLALLSNFFNDSQLITFQANKLTQMVPEILLPDLKLAPKSEMDKFAQKDNELSKDLEAIAEHMKQGKEVHRRPVFANFDPLIDDTDEFLHIVAYVSCVLAVLLLIAMIHMHRRMVLILALVTASKAPKVQAFTLRYLTAPTNLDPSFSWADITPVDHSMATTNAVMLILLIVVIVIHLRAKVKA
jgi:hypothetical protein